MDYLWLKTLHIISATLLFGTGLGSAFYKFMTYRSGIVQAIATTDRLVVRADWLFTTPAVVVQLLTGLWMVYLAGISLTELWILAGLGLYVVAGVCWIPVVFIQLRMRTLSSEAAMRYTTLPTSYRRLMKIWTALGYPAFVAMIVVYFVMTLKPTW